VNSERRENWCKRFGAAYDLRMPSRLSASVLQRERKRCARVIQKLEKLYPRPKLALDFSNPLELLIALILAAQYRDTEVNKLMAVLFKKYPTARDWADAPLSQITQDISRVFMCRRKADYIKSACQRVVTEFGANVPDDLETLVAFKGIGRKTANVLLGNAFGRQTIGVDTHVLRLSQRLGFTKHTDADKVEADLMQIVPENRRTKFCLMLQLHGRQVCTAPVPVCSACAFASLCPYPKSGKLKK
jgi:endonuclease-3